MQMLGKCVPLSISPICVRKDYGVIVLHRDALYLVCYFICSSYIQTSVYFFSSTVCVKPTYYDEAHEIFAAGLGVLLLSTCYTPDV